MINSDPPRLVVFIFRSLKNGQFLRKIKINNSTPLADK
jgi:hypothetical protein